MSTFIVQRALALAAFSPAVLAQGPVFQTPGMTSVPSNYSVPGSSNDSGQANRFSNVFNPAFSFVVDSLVDSIHNSGASEDGERIELRSLEFAAQSWVDPSAWAYFVAVADEENVAIEEAAVHYTGLGGNHTLRAGRFFIDFGKQMQTHVHELRTLERPLVLRTYLGEEVKGDGLQYDGWTGVGDATAVRWSVGAFASLLPESELEDGVPEISVAERKDAGDLNFTARLTAFTDIGTNGVFQAGVSGRFIPDASAELNGSEATGLDSSVYGLDLTYGWTSDDAQRALTTGAEFLLNSGDTSSTIDDAGTPDDPTDDTLLGFDDESQTGWYAFVDWAWNQKHSIGLQYSTVELGADLDAAEAEVYYTRLFSEYHRIRLVASSYDTDIEDGDSLRFAIQYTVTVGAHGHGINW